ncbi:YhjD/YihY/BrkB family envelope integrity protein [Halosimplex pelagicum]|uniref:YihY family inner membrane protein n=1 Tax=Halosimplex pelagicum TaxID=869886 RepID=A0A7D5T1P8_9EURY|nr:YhjD/YihY/BrkB family envelope integrity protein [Halosimplex pelagicum]QLH80571.1 YihY family inner membrane protein [Halosimplex pelagicum]
MDRRVSRALTVGRAVVHELHTERVTFMAGSIAYHAFVSILPLLLLVLAAVSAAGRSDIEQGIIELTRAALTPGAADALVGELQSASTGASLIGIAVLVWGTLRIFRGLDTAFSDIYESSAENTLVDQFVDGAVVFVCVAAVIVVAATLNRAVQFDGPAGWLVGRLVQILALALALLPMYYVFPDEPEMLVREAVPGVAVAAVGLTVFETVFRFYVQFRGEASSGDVLAGLLVFLTWLYFSGLVVLVGVAVNAVLGNRSRDVDIRPVVGGQPRDSEGAAGRGPVDGAALRTTVRDLQRDLPNAERVTLTVDGETVDLPPPDSVEVDAEESRLPFVSDPVTLELRWSADDGE